MKKTIIPILMSLLFTTLFAEEHVDRLGYSHQIGGSVLIACEKEENLKCFGLPFVDIAASYGFTPQFNVNLEIDNLLIIGLLHLKGQYYWNETPDSYFATVGVAMPYLVGDVVTEILLGSVGVGYAQNSMEYGFEVIKNENSSFIFKLSAKQRF